VLAALYQREQTGEGQFVEAAMMDAVYPTLMSPMAAHYRTPEAPPRTGNHHSGLAISPYNVYETNDGYVAIICVNERHWERLTRVMDQPELADAEEYDTNEKRKDRMDEVDDIVESWTKERARDSITDLLLEAGVPCGPVKERDEVLFDPHLEQRDMINEMDHPEYGEIRVPGMPIRLHDSELPDITPAESVGQSNEEILRSMGLSDAEIQELRKKEVI
jgi:CoA:oxalate CoA-transferase